MSVLDQINEVWQTEQEILDVIDSVCRAYGLRYSLAYGTLIGAVRHGGFIPWDDDIDIVMPREDYEKLLRIWTEKGPDGYMLQNRRTNPDFTQIFSKICKDHTTFLQEEEERTKTYHKGIFVDIFPLDRVAPGKLSRAVQYMASAVNLLYTRGYTSGSGGMVGMAEKLLIHVPRGLQIRLRNAAERIIRRWNGSPAQLYFCPSVIASAKIYYSADLFDHMTEIPFNGKKYGCVDQWDAFLHCDYGEYMQLPPESERVWKHHPILIDFEHNYEELEQRSHA